MLNKKIQKFEKLFVLMRNMLPLTDNHVVLGELQKCNKANAVTGEPAQTGRKQYIP